MKYTRVLDHLVAVALSRRLRFAMVSYRVVPATRTTGAQKRLGWVVERVDPGSSPVAASVLYVTAPEAATEAKRLTDVAPAQSVKPFVRFR